MEDPKLLTVLEGMQGSQIKIAEILNQMQARMEANDLTLAKMIADTQRQVADNNTALAQILQHVIDVTTRTERMTAEILTRLASTQGTSH